MVVGELSIECDIAVIGSGPGGYVAAIRAAQLGKDVVIVEKEKKLGGICLNLGCIPTKALITSSDYFNVLKELDMMGINVENHSVDINKMNEWKSGIINKLESGIRMLCAKYGIEIIEGIGTFKDKNTLAVAGQSDVNEIKFKNAIIATGSIPAQIPNFNFDGEHIISSNEAIDLSEIPEKLVIIGGGYIGTELGTVYGKLGSEVHILEGTDRLIGVLDKEIVDVVTKEILKFNVNLHFKSLAKSSRIENSKVQVNFEENEQPQSIICDKVMVVVGRIPNSKTCNLELAGVECDEKGFIKVDSQMRTNIENIFAIGDVVCNPMLAHKASREGKIAAEVICGINSSFDNAVIPSVVFNDPELVSVGMTEDEAKEKGYEILVKKFPYSALGRAYMFDRTSGFIKMVCEKKTKRILGVHAAGPHVSEIVAEATLAIEMGANAEDISLTIHPHPTISEGLSEVADSILGKAINIYEPPNKEDKEDN